MRKRSRIARLPLGLSRGVSAQVLDIALHGLWRRLGLGLARLVELEVGRVDDDVGAGELAELADLDRVQAAWTGPRRPRTRISFACGVDRLDRCVGRIGRSELVGCQGEHPRHVERHVPVSDHDRALVREVELEVLEVGVAVVPGDEGGRRPPGREVLAGDAQPAIGLSTHRVDDCRIRLRQLFVRDVPADLDVAEESEALLARDLLERARPP